MQEDSPRREKIYKFTLNGPKTSIQRPRRFYKASFWYVHSTLLRTLPLRTRLCCIFLPIFLRPRALSLLKILLVSRKVHHLNWHLLIRLAVLLLPTRLVRDLLWNFHFRCLLSFCLTICLMRTSYNRWCHHYVISTLTHLCELFIRFFFGVLSEALLACPILCEMVQVRSFSLCLTHHLLFWYCSKSSPFWLSKFYGAEDSEKVKLHYHKVFYWPLMSSTPRIFAVWQLMISQFSGCYRWRFASGWVPYQVGNRY